MKIRLWLLENMKDGEWMCYAGNRKNNPPLLLDMQSSSIMELQKMGFLGL